MPDDRKTLKLQPETHAVLKERKPDDKYFGEWFLEATKGYGEEEPDDGGDCLTPSEFEEGINGLYEDLNGDHESIKDSMPSSRGTQY